MKAKFNCLGHFKREAHSSGQFVEFWHHGLVQMPSQTNTLGLKRDTCEWLSQPSDARRIEQIPEPNRPETKTTSKKKSKSRREKQKVFSCLQLQFGGPQVLEKINTASNSWAVWALLLAPKFGCICGRASVPLKLLWPLAADTCGVGICVLLEFQSVSLCSAKQLREVRKSTVGQWLTSYIQLNI